MQNKLDQTEKELKIIENELSDSANFSNPKKLSDLNRRRIELSALSKLIDELKKTEKEITEAETLISHEKDIEMATMIQDEIDEKKLHKNKLTNQIEFELLPKDTNDEKNIIIEIRAGAGGDEAALFAAELFRLYTRFAERKNWRIDILSSNRNEIGGFKEIIFEIKGENVYRFLKYESGVHRVQRVPETESGGRIHTSTVTVAVLPEAEEIDLKIEANEIRIDVFRSSGPGGQSVNTTDSAVRITHIPTGLTVSCQDEKSQIKNRDKAMSILRSRLLNLKVEEEAQKRGDTRRSQIGTGDRSEKIRTYNFPQDRVTDHRINFSLHNLPGFMDGNIDEMIDRLIETDQSEALKNLK